MKENDNEFGTYDGSHGESAASYTNDDARESSEVIDNSREMSLGDRIYFSLSHWKNFLFKVGESSQLTYNAMDSHVLSIQQNPDIHISVNYPLGQRPDGSAITGTKVYEKEQLVEEYINLVGYSLPVNAIYNLVIAVEAAIEDATRVILTEFPTKLKSDKKIAASTAFEAKTIEDLRASTVSEILAELAYKSPKDLANTLQIVFSFPLLEIPQYHRYAEVKATRDIHMHNRGIANDTYRRKADTMARVQSGEWLPVTLGYFLESHEHCLKLIEVLAERFDKVWPSQMYREEHAPHTAAEAKK
jgi:hypothetical protein